MNKARREALNKQIGPLEEIKANIEALRDEEQEYFDNMPENLQSGDKGETAQTAIDAAESAISELETAIEAIENACASVEEAAA